MTANTKGNLFVISAPSGAGKSTICKKVLADLEKISFSVSMTTRKPRQGEVDGVDYKFVEVDEFKKTIEKNGFLEWAQVHNNYYGTPISLVREKTDNGIDIILDIDVQGGMQVKERAPESILIFIAPPSMEELERRLKGRQTDSEEVINVRLKNAYKEMEYKDKYDFLIINDNLEQAVEELKNIIIGSRK
ncbi:guanylate kinase [Candidatus Dependentiae bacterium]|nr:guanylate kinase [Candidatus Dependentiae bacterium]